MILYKDILTLIKVTSGDYGNDKTVLSTAYVNGVFIRRTEFIRNNYQENIDSDAIAYVDPKDPYIAQNGYRLEGFYLRCNVLGDDINEGYYKIENCLVNRDHLLSNEIDNIQLLLKKSAIVFSIS